MKGSIEKKIVVMFLASVMALLAIAWLAYRTIQHSLAAQDWVGHTYAVISTIEQGRAQLANAEAATRGFLLTGDDTFLRESQAAQSQVNPWFTTLRHLTDDNSIQQKNLDQLQPLISRQLMLLKDRIQARRQSGINAVMDDAATQAGANLTGQISRQLTVMRDEENGLLAARQRALRSDVRGAEIFAVADGLLACLMGVLAAIFTHRDLTLRRMAQETLRQNEERLRLMIKSVRDYAILMLDPNGRVVTWNAGAQRIKGYTEEEILGQHFSRFYPKEIAESDFPRRELAEAATKGTFEDENWRVRKDGSRFWANVVVTAVRDDAGKLIGFVKVTRDMTEWKRAEQIKEEHDRFFEMSRDLIAVYGFGGFFKALNPAWEETLGYAREELLAAPFIELVHPDDRPATEAEWKKLMVGGETINFENRYRCKSGAYRWFSWGSRSDLSRKLIYAAARDVTGQKESNEKISQLNLELQRHARQLEAANKELEAFSYSVSHDLRAPLRHIDGFVKLLEKHAAGLDDRSRRYLEIIADSARRMGALIDDLLIFSRMGRTALRRTKVESESLIHEVLDSMQNETQGRDIEWQIRSLPQIEADPAMLRQVWSNLISNAVKYSRPRHPAKIEIGCNAENGEMVFYVRDNGVGFDMQYAHKLFGVFQRLHRAEEFEGTGIGLANVQRIVHRHGGRVWAEGKLNAGATFFFSLPKPQTTTETEIKK